MSAVHTVIEPAVSEAHGLRETTDEDELRRIIAALHACGARQ